MTAQHSDEQIQEEICERLNNELFVDDSQITVKVKDGIVTLNGSVDKSIAGHRIESIVSRCSGVKNVKNQLRVLSLKTLS